MDRLPVSAPFAEQRGSCQLAKAARLKFDSAVAVGVDGNLPGVGGRFICTSDHDQRQCSSLSSAVMEHAVWLASSERNRADRRMSAYRQNPVAAEYPYTDHLLLALSRIACRLAKDAWGVRLGACRVLAEVLAKSGGSRELLGRQEP